jgi:tetratricopeptide (TPR) repeat protein
MSQLGVESTMRPLPRSLVALPAALLTFMSVPMVPPAKPLTNLAEQAYYEIESDILNRSAVESALAKLQRARTQKPKDPWPYLAMSLAVLASGYKIGDWYEMQTFSKGTVDKALALATKAVEVAPKESQSHAHLARILIIRGEYKKAWNSLNEGYNKNRGNFYVWYFRGIIAEKMRDVAHATSYFDEASKRASHRYQSMLVNLHRENIAKIAGNLQEQERILKENIAKNPNNPHIYGNYGYFLMKQKRYDEAIQYWQKAIELGPYREAVDRLEETKRLKQLDR